MTRSPAVFLVDVDDTLLENDRIQDNLRRHIEQEFDPECQDGSGRSGKRFLSSNWATATT